MDELARVRLDEEHGFEKAIQSKWDDIGSRRTILGTVCKI